MLISVDKWRCMKCLEPTLPGRDSTSKSMNKMVEYAQEMREAFDLEAEGSNAEGPRNRAQWAEILAAEIKKQAIARSKEVTQANREAVPPKADKFLYNTLTIADFAAVEASFDRTRLLTEHGADVAAMALDAVNTIQAENSLEKMLAHQLARLTRPSWR